MAYATETQLKKGLTQMKSYADTALDGKQAKETGKGLSTNDYTTEEKTKLAGLSNYDDTELVQKVTNLEEDIDSLKEAGGVTDSVAWGSVIGKPEFAVVATSGDYEDLTNKPDTAIKNSIAALDVTLNGTIITVQDLQDAIASAQSSITTIEASIDGLATVASTGSYNDLTDKPDQVSDYDDTAIKNSIKALDVSVKAAQEEIITLGSGIVSLSLDKANKADLADVATSGSYDDLTDTPDEYTLPPATASTLGGIKAGSGLNVLADGTLVVTTPADGQTQTGATNVLSWNATKKDIEYYAVGDEANKQYLGMPDFAGQIESAKESLESEVSAVVNLVGETSGKNLLPSGGDGATKSYNGISFVVNSDGSITANGTATADAYYNLIPSTAAKTFTEGKYILSGCPAGGSASTYRLAVHQADPDTNYNDTGSAVEFATDGTKAFNAFILIRSGTTVSSLTFYPMIRPASITDSTYQAYSLSNAQITEELSDTGWQEITLNDGFTVDGGQGAKVRKKNGMVTVVFGIRASTAFGTSNIIPFNLPDAYKPSAPINFTAFAAVGTQMALIGYIPANSTNMNIRCMSGTATSAYGTVSYPV